MNIIISNSSGRPIYEQITTQVKGMVTRGELLPGDLLPSMRQLARDLHISVITTKRAYEDLERDGFLESVAGKGSFVAEKNIEVLREEQRKLIEQSLQSAVDHAHSAKIPLSELEELLRLLY